MGEKTGIEWTDSTWNPIRGCREVSPGCANCYAAEMAGRFSGPGQPYHGLVRRDGMGRARWNGQVQVIPEHLFDPLRWQRPRAVFVNSMSDLFHESLSFDFIAGIVGVMQSAPRHTFQVLTKRAGRLVEFLDWLERYSNPGDTCLDYAWQERGESVPSLSVPAEWPPKNVILGVSVEDQTRADERLPLLARVNHGYGWQTMVSAEPLLGPIAAGHGWDWQCSDWWIVGGESGRGARPLHTQWVRPVRDGVIGAGVPFFFKQWGHWVELDQSPECAVLRETGMNPGFCWIGLDGRPVDGTGSNPGPGEICVYAFGKHQTGRFLDGRHWNEAPEQVRRFLEARNAQVVP